MKKKGFSGDGRTRGVDEWACQLQMHLLEERVSKQCLTRRHAPASEFQCRTGDRPVWAHGKVFSSEASTGR